MDLDKLTIGEARQLAALLGGAGGGSRRLPMPIGKTVFVRTVTHHYCGIVSAVAEEEVELSEVSWIADDGRFADALKSGQFNEVEPYPEGVRVTLNRAAMLDWCVVTFAPPRAQK